MWSLVCVQRPQIVSWCRYVSQPSLEASIISTIASGVRMKGRLCKKVLVSTITKGTTQTQREQWWDGYHLGEGNETFSTSNAMVSAGQTYKRPTSLKQNLRVLKLIYTSCGSDPLIKGSLSFQILTEHTLIQSEGETAIYYFAVGRSFNLGVPKAWPMDPLVISFLLQDLKSLCFGDIPTKYEKGTFHSTLSNSQLILY